MLNQDKDALPHLLARCTARLMVRVHSRTETGTGFFVGPGYLLTCAHVVIEASQGNGSIEAEWNGQKYSATIEKITSRTYPDLAFLKIESLRDHPCVYLYDAISLNSDLY